MHGQRRRGSGPERSGATMRLFFAVWPPEETAEALHRWARRVREATGGRAVDACAIHLTLAFLGALPESHLGKVLASARRAGAAPHALPLDAARQVARRGLVWAGPAQTPPLLEALATSLQAELRSEGFELDRREFLAHVTLLRQAGTRVELPQLPPLDWPVTEFTLVQSRLGSGPANYEILARFPLVAGERVSGDPAPPKSRASAGQ